MCSGRAVVRQNNDEPHVEQNPYATVGSGEYHFKVASLVKRTALTDDPVPAMWCPVNRRHR
jgi:hypothetical protein